MTLAAKISAAGTRQVLFSMVFIARGEARRAMQANLLAPSLVLVQAAFCTQIVRTSQRGQAASSGMGSF